MSDDEEEFEEQIRLEKLEASKNTELSEIIEDGRVKIDEDGTEFEWDAKKKAWFPKINEDFIAQYQMNYGNNPLNVEPKKGEQNSSDKGDDSSYAAWYSYYNGAAVVSDNTDNPGVRDPAYPKWYYKRLYGVDPDETDEKYKEWAANMVSQSDGAEDTPAVGDPAYPKWYYKQLYGVDPDETDEKYKEWAANMVSQSSGAENSSESQKEEEGKTKEPPTKKKKPEPTWFEQTEEHNTSVYVQGLPDDITEDEFKDMMSKCGIIAYDYDKKKLKLKLYTDKKTGQTKGDGLCTYIKRESVDLAMQLIDESTLRGSKMEVQLAEFKLKGEFDPKLRRKPKNNKAKRREKEKQAKLLDWRPDKLPDERHVSEKTVVLKNLFDPAEFDKNPAAIQEVRADMRQECSKYGEIKKITIYDRNAEGVITVTFKEFEEADLCISSLNHRWFGGRRVMASNWNGKEKYEVKETAEQEAERLRKWDEYLESGGDDDSKS
ncbi:HTATSF1 [Bugula neritina]|uniref:17S U2 SnRNP complex component HTATSF1 n=1 Tax=Bugula neritina TaxID=10212 RepID=A0A7J7KKV6_BUGNE|nr:HTATSF1 [Bugula neritina]